MKAVTRITFVTTTMKNFSGKVPAVSLHAIEETGSLRSAAISMGLAYTKALRIIKNAEAALGFPLTTLCWRKIRRWKYTHSTGKEWLTKYETYRDACVHANRKLYLEIFFRQAVNICSLTGDRGSGKTTLLSALFPCPMPGLTSWGFQSRAST